MKHRPSRAGRASLGLAAALGAAAVVLGATDRRAAAEESIDVVTIQARVVLDGVPVDGDLAVEFEVWTASTAGTKLWGPEAQTVPVRNGLLAARLGVVLALGPTFKPRDDVSTTERWVAIKLSGGSEITPRIRLTAVPYSHRASAAEIASRLSSGSTSYDLPGVAALFAGNGLTASGTTLAIGGGDGLAVSGDAIAVGLVTNGGLAFDTSSPKKLQVDAATVDGDKLDIDFTPTTYSPSTSGTQADNTGQLAAHLKGIDVALSTAGAVLPGVAGGRLSIVIPTESISATPG